MSRSAPRYRSSKGWPLVQMKIQDMRGRMKATISERRPRKEKTKRRDNGELADESPKQQRRRMVSHGVWRNGENLCREEGGFLCCSRVSRDLQASAICHQHPHAVFLLV